MVDPSSSFVLSHDALASVLPFVNSPNRLDVGQITKTGMKLVLLDDPEYVDAKVVELNAALRELSHQTYYSVDTYVLFHGGGDLKLTAHDAQDDHWRGFSDFDGSGFAPRTTSTMFFSMPVDFLLLREGGVDPVWLCGPDKLLRSVLNVPATAPLPNAIGTFTHRPDLAEVVMARSLASPPGT